jgi:hypothetical protein
MDFFQFRRIERLETQNSYLLEQVAYLLSREQHRGIQTIDIPTTSNTQGKRRKIVLGRNYERFEMQH